MTVPNHLADTVYRIKARDLYDSSQAFCLSLLVPLDAILGSSRKQDVTHARHAYWYWLHDHHGLTLSAIGRLLRRDHTTIMHGVDRHLNRQHRIRQRRHPSEVVADVTVKPQPSGLVPRTVVPWEPLRMCGYDRMSIEEQSEGGWTG